MKRILMLIALAASAAGTAGALAKLPPPTDAQKAKAEETKARTAWTDKVAAYKLCQVQDKTAARYYSDMKAQGKQTKEPMQTPACADPGPFVPPSAASAPAAAPAPAPGPAAEAKPAAAAVQSPAKAP
ncbi:hypothetical protein [Cupriavidus sp. IDO]|uniref:hypothetical protein n=1 Tax=Cupriavidus sp. IDO TaxID=1539142 RepID=UPI0005793A69|nr:hypothetical protein [Cupriavidus sp. IDO]KWR90124.1 hypothetical protein RM96_10525 [Cupriavidus sp. IDO]